MTFVGDFGADGRIVFDSRSLDDLDLDYQVRDRCRVNAVPTALARETFRHPFTHRVYLPDGTTQDEETGPGTTTWTQLDQISPFMEVAVTTTEDGAFRSHHGFNRSAIKSSLIANLKARRFVRGASTITMQLAKNLFLSREKTLSRKLEEVILSDYLEQILSKDEILELYLNVVEFGPAVYGVTAAADYYFGRSPAELDAAEAFFLASILPSPLRYTTVRDSAALSESRLVVLRSLMRAAQKRGLLSDDELAEALREPVEFWHGDQRPAPRPSVRPRAHRAGAPEDDVDPAAGDTDPPP
jgi:membrane peptidoglycan carboxypeptidase